MSSRSWAEDDWEQYDPGPEQLHGSPPEEAAEAAAESEGWTYVPGTAEQQLEAAKFASGLRTFQEGD